MNRENGSIVLRSGSAALAIGVLLNVAFAQDEMMAFPPARVETANAELRNMAPVVQVSGTVVSLNDSRIASEVQGALTWIAEVGEGVEAGAPIARIDARLLEVAVRRAMANVARLEAEHLYRERQLERAEELAANNNASANLLDESRATRDQVEHQLADARAQLERAEGDLERSVIRAAFAGHVTERLASVGEFIDIGEDVVRLVDTHRMEIALPASIALTKYLQPGLPVAVTSDGVERQHAIRAVVPVGDAVSRLVEVRLAVEEGDWLVGTPVQISLPSSTPMNAVAVPRDALVERGGQTFVYKVMDDGTAQQIDARLSATVGLWVALVDGVDAGDTVIVRGAERLTDGQQVVVIGEGGSR